MKSWWLLQNSGNSRQRQHRRSTGLWNIFVHLRSKHTGNQWKDTDNWRADQKISNRVYQMTCSIWEDTKYDRETKQSVPIAWYVTWEVRIHSPKQGYGAKIAGQNQKRYTDKNAAIKYLDGRKKAYSHLFTEISPPIPKEYEHHFMVHGNSFTCYTVEGLEQAKTEHAAAEVSEGGILYTRKPGEAFRPGEALLWQKLRKKRQPLPVRQ